MTSETQYHHVYYNNRDSSSVFLNLYELQDVQNDPGLKVWTRYDYDAFTHKTSMIGGPPWKEVKYRVTTDLDENLILTKERVFPGAQYDWHSVLPGNVRRNIRTDLYIRNVDLDEDDVDSFSIVS